MVDLQNLIHKCLKNDERAKRQLVDLYSGKLAGICRRYVSAKEDIQDLVQDSFIKIFLNLDKFDAERGEFGAWIYRITLNIVFKHQNDKLKDLKFESLDTEEYFETANNTGSVLPEGLGLKDILSFIDTLPKGRRTVFNMYFIEGYKHHEIAGILNITEGASKAHLNKARMQLIEIINHNTK